MQTKINPLKIHIKRLFVFICIIFTSINLVADDYWIKQNFPYDVSISLIRINQNDELFVGAVFMDSVPWGNGRIYRSLDFATTWEDITPFSYFSEVHDILIDTEGVLYVGTWYGGVFRSYDNGNSFEEASDGLSNTVPSVLAQQSNGTIYAGQFWGGGVDYTENDGDQWYLTNFPGVGINGLAIDGFDAIFASGGGIGLYYSDDNGVTWSERNYGFSSIAKLNYKCFAFTEGVKTYSGTSDGVYISENNGEEWVNCLNSQRVYHILIINDKVFAGTFEEGVYFSDDGGSSWSQKNEGLDWFTVYSLVVDSENFIWCNTPEGIYRSKETLVSTAAVKQSQNEISFYPNPCDNSLNLLYSEIKCQNVEMTFFDLNGRLILETNIEKDHYGVKDYSFDVSSFNPGIYFVCLKTDSKTKQTEKLVIR